jgi:hypothetical protein
MMGNLFNKHFPNDFVNHYRKSLSEKIGKLEITDATDVVALVDRLKSEFTIYPIDIKEPKPSEPKETSVQRQNMFRETYQQKVFEIFVTIPFEGNKDLFFCHPSTSTVVNLDKSVSINSNTITATIVLDKLDENAYFSKVNEIIGTLKSNLPRIHAEIKPWNDGLENLIKQSLESRKGVVSQKFDFMEKIGLKVNPKSTEYLVPPTVIKKAIPKPATETSKNVAKEKVPILQQEVYADIREVLYNVGKAIERKTSIYKDKHEEDLRDIFLLFLETRYEATTGVGEAFNKKGKTDILLKYAKDGTNLFVAECKFWKGQKEFLKAIDQLLGYLTHRDSKTALIFFVNHKEISNIVTTIKTEITQHNNYFKHIKDTYEHSINYEFSLPDDSNKKIQVEVMLFHFPTI